METATERGALKFFPAGKTPRPEQRTALEEIEGHFGRGTKFVAFQGPVGSGKSYVGTSLAYQAAAIGQQTHIITAQKVLQGQYEAEFHPPTVEVMKGRSNYRCSYDALSRNAANGYCRRVEKVALIKECLKSGTIEQAQKFDLLPDSHMCEYWAQMTRAVHAPIALFNFHSFLFQQQLERFGRRDLMVIDECHNVENVLLGFVQLTLSDKILAKLDIRLDLSLKSGKDVLAWLERGRVTEKIQEALGGPGRTEEAAFGFTTEESDRLQSMRERIEGLRKYLDLTKWIVDVTEEGDEDDPKDRTRKLRVRPVFVSLFARELIFSKADRTLAMSATILDPKVWARNLGLSMRDVGYVEVPCTFPVKNRPIIPEYAGDMGWNTLQDTLPKLYGVLARILERHKGQRGIIHGHSETLCKRIIENVRSPRFVHPDMFPNRDKTALLKAHVGRPDSVIVASGMHEGVDLKDDLARFAVLAKVPWPSTEDAFVKARMEEDGFFLPYQAALKLVQSSGRVVRHEKDFAVTYVTDAGFEKFLKRCGWLLPKWFTDAIQKPKKEERSMF